MRYIFLVLWLTVALPSSSAEIYRYKDDNGQIWFADRIEAIPERYRDQLTRILTPDDVEVSQDGKGVVTLKLKGKYKEIFEAAKEKEAAEKAAAQQKAEEQLINDEQNEDEEETQKIEDREEKMEPDEKLGIFNPEEKGEPSYD